MSEDAPHAAPAAGAPRGGGTDDVAALRARLGDTDVYLLDQVLRGRIGPGARVLDAGCGTGRNVLWFLRAGFEVRAVDRDAERVATLRDRAGAIPGARLDARVGDLHALPFADASADVVLAVAVLHFAADRDDLRAQLDELWRVLAAGGLLFARLASSIGLEERVEPRGRGRYRLPDGTDRYLVDRDQLREETERLGATLLDPVKTVNVSDTRCMTTWVLGKPV